ncbi:major facilitator superfamily domain-containing protein [Aspergillus insuetus]
MHLVLASTSYVVFGSFCCLLCVFGVINSAAVFELHFSENQLSDHSHTQISWIFSLYLFTVYFLGTLAGPVFDIYGHRLLVLVGSICLAVSPMLLSFATSYYQIILTFSIFSGIGGALLNTPAFAVIAHYFFLHRGLATGIAASAGGIGGIIFPLVLRRTLSSLGFAWSMRILGFILLAVLIPANLLLRSRTSVRQGTNRSPSTPPTSNDEAPAAARASTPKAKSAWPDFHAFKDLKFTLCCAGIFLMEYGVLIPLTYIMSYATAHNISTGDTYILPALLNAGSVAGRVIPGLLADKLGRFNMLLATMAGCASTVLAMWLPVGVSESKPLLTAFTFLLGFTSGGNVSLVPVCIGQLDVCGTERFGRCLSAAMLVAGFGTLTGIPIGGAILGGDTGSGTGDVSEVRWTGLVLFSGLAYVVSFGAFLAARGAAVGWGVKVY